MNVLFFTYAYPPLKYPRSIQISRLVKYSTHRIIIACCDDEGAVKDPTIPGEFTGQPAKIFRFQRKERLQGLLRRFVNALSVPDPYRIWAMQAARDLIDSGKLSDTDVFVTFGQPMSDHLAGLEIKKATGLPWVAHFSDPWLDNPFRGHNILRRNLDRLYEQRVVEAADLLVFTSRQTVELVMAKYPSAWTAKARVLPHSFDPELYSSPVKSSNEVVVRHLGNFYPPRSPENFIQALHLLNERSSPVLQGVRIELIGNISDRIQLKALLAGLPEGLFALRPSVEYLESLELMAESDLLLVIDAPYDSSVFLPSKLVDYIGAEKPIFAITPPGATAELVSRYGGVVAYPTDPVEIAEKFENILTQLKIQREESMTNLTVRAEYSAEHVAVGFDEMLQQMSEVRK